MSVSFLPYDENNPKLLHHIALCPADMEKSLQFYRDGIGLQPLMDEVLPGPYRAMLDARSDSLRTIFLGDPNHSNAGVVELVEFEGGTDLAPEAGPSRHGFFCYRFG